MLLVVQNGVVWSLYILRSKVSGQNILILDPKTGLQALRTLLLLLLLLLSDFQSPKTPLFLSQRSYVKLSTHTTIFCINLPRRIF